MHISKPAILIFLLYISTTSQANSVPYRLDFGYLLQDATFDVFKPEEFHPNGVLSEDARNTVFVSLVSPTSSVGNFNFGYRYELSYSNFEFGRQDIADETVDLGTSIRGEYFYLVPTIFYEVGTKQEQQGFNTKIGIGYGLGYLRAKGDIQFTKNDENTIHQVKVKDWDTALSVFIEIRYVNWLTKISVNSPSVTENGFQYDITEFSLRIGYSVPLHF